MKNISENYKKSKQYNKPSGLLKGFFNMQLHKTLKKRVAIDLGAGVGNDTKFLIDEGFEVTCIDIEEKSKEEILNKIENKSKLKIIIDNFENINLHKADLIYSCFSLCFCTPNKIDNLINEIIGNIEPEGFFVR